jgi:hypothetical protein
VQRKRFDHLLVELSVSVGRVVPRYALWLLLQELGHDPELLSREAVLAFLDEQLEAFLAEHDLGLSAREDRRLRRSLERYDPAYPTPYETMERLFSSPGR